MKSSRREFLKRSAAAGALVTAPYILANPRSVRSAEANGKRTIAAIGVGGSRGAYNQGGAIARNASRFGTMIAVCDVDDVHTAEFNKRFDGKLKTYRDYRKLFDELKPEVVTIGTPDHWHVPIAIHALRAGADVYCEKPLTLTIDEGKQIRKVVEETGKVFQVGTQQRSQDDSRFLKAIAMVQSGRLGKNVNAYVAIGGGPAGGPFADSDPPTDLDWNMWVGPAPEAGYSQERRKEFRWWYAYSGGKMTDWGAHHIDIAQWALGRDHSGPVKVKGTGKFTPIVPDDLNWEAFLNGEITLPAGYNTATKFSIDLEFDNGAVINVNDYYERDDNTKFDNGILFEGSEGRIFVNRGRLSGKPIDELSAADKEEIDSLVIQLYKGKQPGDHMGNFWQCLDSREQPISDVATHHRTMTSCHLCNIALMLGRDLQWDPKKEEFVGDEQANALMTRKSREGFGLEA
jgi:myo-inositol 2-dehydrogenase / D-chiro-inositol 1-dehydrogenase